MVQFIESSKLSDEISVDKDLKEIDNGQGGGEWAHIPIEGLQQDEEGAQLQGVAFHGGEDDHIEQMPPEEMVQLDGGQTYQLRLQEQRRHA